MTFPLASPGQGLRPEDFDLFAGEFSRIVLHYIPYAEGPVTFIALAGNEPSGKGNVDRPAAWRQDVRKVIKQQRPQTRVEKLRTYLPIRSEAGLFGIAVLDGLEPSFAKSVSNEWLNDRCDIIAREFYHHKQLASDPITGLLNIRYLTNELSHLLAERSLFTLVLIDIYPKANNTEKARRYISRARYYLESYFGQQPLIYLDFGVFAFIWPGISGQQAQGHGKIMIDLLKREDFNRAHLGMTTVVDLGDPLGKLPAAAEEQRSPEKIIDQAWQALLTACRRGPFALCPYDSIRQHANHPLARPPASVRAKMRHRWRGSDRFAVVFLENENVFKDGKFSKRMLSLIAGEASHLVTNGQVSYVLLDNCNEQQALAWAKSLNEKMKNLGKASFTMGIAVYPMHHFKKSDTIINAKKALLHTKFYGPGTVTAFDAVSLNVSGDIYYREGDLRRAVQEYRLGLALEPTNSNLLNSLGEAYAQMNRRKEALGYFQKAVEIDAGNYMALFNLGVVYYKLGEDELAIEYFTRARAVTENLRPNTEESPVGYELTHDLLLPLGRLYCKTGRYKEAVEFLAEGVRAGGEGVGVTNRKYVNRGGVLRYLGKAYKGLDRNAEAIAVLQRAINHNPRDATSLSLLGELYCQEKQGNEIALSLCRQAVELDDSRWDHWYRLGRVLFLCGDVEEARKPLQGSIAKNPKNTAARYLLGQVYQQLGQKKQAAKMYKMILKLTPFHSQAAAALAGLHQNDSIH
jgi:tetratricopeptide (TPR) repeat protein